SSAPVESQPTRSLAYRNSELWYTLRQATRAALPLKSLRDEDKNEGTIRLLGLVDADHVSLCLGCLFIHQKSPPTQSGRTDAVNDNHLHYSGLHQNRAAASTGPASWCPGRQTLP